MVSAPALARPTTFAREACACSRIGREVSGAERRAHRPQHLAAVLVDEGGCVLLEFLSEDIIGSNEKPAVIARLYSRFTRALGERVGVKGVVDRVGPAVFVGQAHHGGGVHDEDLVPLLGDLVHGERGRGARDIEDRFDALLVEPLPGQRGGKVDLVLMVGEDDLYRAPQHLPPKSSTAIRVAVTVPWPPMSA